jgi:hypothetical protein
MPALSDKERKKESCLSFVVFCSFSFFLLSFFRISIDEAASIAFKLLHPPAPGAMLRAASLSSERPGVVVRDLHGLQ